MSAALVFRGVLVALLTSATLHAYRQLQPPETIIFPQPRSPAESLASIRVGRDLEVELVAAEPMVMDPIDLAWDADGRMWVVEMADYPLGLDGRGMPGGRIRVLESTQGDGLFDRSRLFAEGLRTPTSVLPWRNGVLVTAAPDILFLEDTDGDGRADRTTKMYTGLAEGNQQHLANGLQWSLDAWLHIANGDSGGSVRSSQSGRTIELGRRDFRIRPDDGGLELLSGQTQFGRNRDDWGNWFGCNNSNPIWHYALEEYYLRRNPHLSAPSAIVSVSAMPGAGPVFPISETIARFNNPQGYNRFTSACGVMIYRDDLLGSEYAGNAFVCEPVHNLVSRQILQPAGVSFQGARAPAEEAAEFFSSTDSWSRFTASRAGPDGALYIVDMYRLVIEHPKWIPDAWQKQLVDVRAGEAQGRIYRVRPRATSLRPVPRLQTGEAKALVAALESPSGVLRDLTQQQLLWRKERGAASAVAAVASGSVHPSARAQALWTLQGLNELTPELVHGALGDPHPGVRRQAVRLSEPLADSHPVLLPTIVRLADDPDPAVRQQVAYTLGEWRERLAGETLARVLRANEDPLVRAAALSSALPHAETLIAELSASGRGDDPLLIEIATVTENIRALSSILRAIATPRPHAREGERFSALAMLLEWLQRNNKSLAQLQSADNEEMADALEAADAIFVSARLMVADRAAALDQRVAAVSVLGRGRAWQAEDLELLANLLSAESPIDLQLSAVAALGRIHRAVVPVRILERWSGYGPAVRAAVLQLLTSRPAWTHVLLDRLEADRGMLAQISPAVRTTLTQHMNSGLAQRALKIFGSAIDADRQQIIDQYLAALSITRGEAARGRTVFAQICSGCHQFGEAVPGRAFGPDMASVKDRSAAYLLTHILDPNRAVEDRYVLYTAATHDGRMLAGMVTGESGNSLTLIGVDGSEQSLQRSEIRSLASTGRSLMPDGLEAVIPEQAMADLIAYLAENGQKPAERESLPSPGGGKPLSGLGRSDD